MVDLTLNKRFQQMLSSALLRIPSYAIFKGDKSTSENIERAPNGKVDLAIAQQFHLFQITNTFTAPCVGYGNSASSREFLNEFFVHSVL